MKKASSPPKLYKTSYFEQKIVRNSTLNFVPTQNAGKKDRKGNKWQREERVLRRLLGRWGRKNQEKWRRQLRAEMTGQQERVRAQGRVSGAGQRTFRGPEQHRWVSWDVLLLVSLLQRVKGGWPSRRPALWQALCFHMQPSVPSPCSQQPCKEDNHAHCAGDNAEFTGRQWWSCGSGQVPICGQHTAVH